MPAFWQHSARSAQNISCQRYNSSQLAGRTMHRAAGRPAAKKPRQAGKSGLRPAILQYHSRRHLGQAPNLGCRWPSSGDAPASHPSIGTHAEVPSQCHGSGAGGRPRRHMHAAHEVARSLAVRSPPFQAKFIHCDPRQLSGLMIAGAADVNAWSGPAPLQQLLPPRETGRMSLV